MTDVIERHRVAIADLCRRYGVVRLDVFGSATRDDFRPDASDIDLLVRFTDLIVGGAADRYLGLVLDLEDLFGRRIDLVSDTAIRNPYFREIVDRTRMPLYAA